MSTPWKVHQAYHRRQRELVKETAVVMDLLRATPPSDAMCGVFYAALTHLREEQKHVARQLHPAGKQQ